MEPLSKEEIDEVESFAQVYFAPVPERWQRLFYTARLGAAYEQAMKNQKEQQP